MTAPQSSNEVFDVRKIRRLVELMQENELTEIDLQQGDTRIQLRREKEQVMVASPAQPVPMSFPMQHAPAPAAPAPQPVAEVPAAVAPAEDAANIAIIKSPMVGTFYSASDPESPPFVNVGDMVGPTSTVCLVEAMKVFNEIQAEVSGKIISVLIKNGEPVDFGQPMFKVDTQA